MSTANLTPEQQNKVKQFIDVAGERVSQSIAVKYLSKAKWNSENAINNFWDSPPDEKDLLPAIDTGAIVKTFDKYAVDGIIEEKIADFLADLSIADDDVVSLAIPWQCNAQHVGEFTKEEFITGMKAMGATTIDELKAKISNLRSKLNDPESFKAFYAYCFDYARSVENKPEKKVLDISAAVMVWKIVFGSKVPYLEKWISYMEHAKRNAVNRDTWNLFLQFTKSVKADFSDYDPNGAWPVAIDDFVQYATKGPQPSSS